MIRQIWVRFPYKLAYSKDFVKFRERLTFAPSRLSNRMYQHRQGYLLSRSSESEIISYDKSSFLFLAKLVTPDNITCQEPPI